MNNKFTQLQIDSGLYFASQYAAVSCKEIPRYKQESACKLLHKLNIPDDLTVTEDQPVYFDVEILIGKPGYRHRAKQAKIIINMFFKDSTPKQSFHYTTLKKKLTQNEYVLLTEIFTLENRSL